MPQPGSRRAKAGSFQDAQDRSEATQKDRMSPYVSQLALAGPCRPERPLGSALGPAWQHHNNDANSGRGLVSAAGGSIPHEELLPSPKSSASRAARLPQRLHRQQHSEILRQRMIGS